MITITLQKIKDNNPCKGGWKQILEAQGPDLNREWPLVEALKSNALSDVLWALRCLPEHDNLWRKYAVWCARHIEHLLIDQRSKDALNVAWRHSNSEASDEELAAAWTAAWTAARTAARTAAWDAASDAAMAAARAAAWDAASDAAMAAARAAAWDAAWTAASDAAMAAWDAQKEKLIQILTAGEWVDK